MKKQFSRTPIVAVACTPIVAVACHPTTCIGQ